METDFLILSILCCIPGSIIFLFRKDLRRILLTVSLSAIPFAFTESLFYPSYWEPHFLWGLADKIGFGIEDIIFVIGLGALTSSVYPFFFSKKVHKVLNAGFKLQFIRFASVILITALLVFVFYMLRIPMIYGAVAVMILISIGIVLIRKDLFMPSLAGGVITCIIYSLICLIFSMIFKDVFHIVWHGDKFSGVYIAGILLEEYLYSFSAGMAGTVFYPFFSGRTFE